MIGDNHLLAKNKLKKLSEFLNKNKDLPHKYNNIIDDQKERSISLKMHLKVTQNVTIYHVDL